jgi:alcohol dehydrogenase class IV
VTKAFEQYTADGCNGVLAIGGGSAMDLGKAVALLAGSGGPLTQYDPLAGGGQLVKDGRAFNRRADHGGHWQRGFGRVCHYHE